MNSKLSIFLKSWVYWTLLFAIIFYSWVALHESSHALSCKILGGDPSLVQILPHPLINCAGIINGAILNLSKMEYFFYAISPYMLALIVLISLNSNKKLGINFSYPLVLIILLDVFVNYVGSLTTKSDFRLMAGVSVTWFILSVIISLLSIMIGLSILKKRWRDFKTSFFDSVRT